MIKEKGFIKRVQSTQEVWLAQIVLDKAVTTVSYFWPGKMSLVVKFLIIELSWNKQLENGVESVYWNNKEMEGFNQYFCWIWNTKVGREHCFLFLFFNLCMHLWKVILYQGSDGMFCCFSLGLMFFSFVVVVVVLVLVIIVVHSHLLSVCCLTTHLTSLMLF